MEIYCIKQDEELKEWQFELLASLVSKEKRAKIYRFKRYEHAQRKLISDILARFVIVLRTGLRNDQIRLQHNPYGKPYLDGFPDFHYNLSASEDLVVCAYGNQSVGIDIQWMRPIDLQVAECSFSNSELEYLRGQNDSHQMDAFYELWTLKESYIKAVGKGLYLPLNEFTINMDRKPFIYVTDKANDGGLYRFRQIEIDSAYSCAVCLKGEIQRVEFAITGLAGFVAECLRLFGWAGAGNYTLRGSRFSSLKG
jgi:4'-phosphopantetheinyl transferase